MALEKIGQLQDLLVIAKGKDVTQDKMKELIERAASNYGIPALLVASIAEVESNSNPWSTRYEPHFNYLYKPEEFSIRGIPTVETEKQMQKMSWGLMQVMGATAREMGFKGRFLAELCDPSLSLEYGCRYLKRQYGRYNDWNHAIAAYNAGSARKREDGTFFNQRYVDLVLREWK